MDENKSHPLLKILLLDIEELGLGAFIYLITFCLLIVQQISVQFQLHNKVIGY